MADINTGTWPSKSYAHTNNCKNKITCCEKRERKKEKTEKKFNAGLLARSQLHSEGPATGQLDQGFPWFSSVPEQMLGWYPHSTLHCMLPMKPSQW
jgi:hypothetical protein